MLQIFSINFTKLVIELLPSAKRGQSTIDFVYSLMKPMVLMYKSFVSFYSEQSLGAVYNSQVIVLEDLLNKKFGTGGQIKIIDGESAPDGVWMSNHADKIEGIWMSNHSESIEGVWIGNYTTNADLDFWVEVPNSLLGVSDVARIKAIVNKYKFAGKTFDVRNKTI